MVLLIWMSPQPLLEMVRLPLVPCGGVADADEETALLAADARVLESHLEPLTDQQLMGICNLQQSLQQAEDALSQGMEALQQTLGDTLASAAATVVVGGVGADNVTNSMGQMAIAMAMLTTLENFLKLRSNINGELNCLLPWRDAMIFLCRL
uniref:DOG1 domain-containing protein n=1 Tax=Oryza glaberrima TaxID=4538 RepID=I1QNU8_ORYGL